MKLDQGYLTDWLVQMNEGLDGAAETALLVLPTDRDENILTAHQMQHKDVVEGIWPAVQTPCRILINQHLEDDVRILPGHQKTSAGFGTQPRLAVASIAVLFDEFVLHRYLARVGHR